jgi:PhoD-like phosphatase, N-terminal domain
MSITRRELLRRAGLFGAALTIPSFSACRASGDESAGDSSTGTSTSTGDGTETGEDGLPSYEWEGELGPDTMFSHGLASGDPLLDAVVLWTRCSPGEGPTSAVEAFFEVALDSAFEQRVAADWVMSDTARDNTIKIDITDLEPETTYYYRFFAQGRVSPIGRTRTAATTREHLRIAVVSCSSLAHGYFHIGRAIGSTAATPISPRPIASIRSSPFGMIMRSPTTAGLTGPRGTRSSMGCGTIAESRRRLPTSSTYRSAKAWPAGSTGSCRTASSSTSWCSTPATKVASRRSR